MTEQPWQGRDDTAFDVEVPPGWEVELDEEEGGITLADPERSGMLHLISFPAGGGEMLDPAEELYAFLEEQGIELEEDEVEDLELGEDAELSLCAYLSEEEDDEEEIYWLIAVAAAPGNLVFASYSCPAGEEEQERQTLRRLLASLRPHPFP